MKLFILYNADDKATTQCWVELSTNYMDVDIIISNIQVTGGGSYASLYKSCRTNYKGLFLWNNYATSLPLGKCSISRSKVSP